MPTSLSEIVGGFTDLPFNPGGKQDMQAFRQMLSIPLNPERHEFTPVPGAGNYAPIVYLPQLIGIWLGRLMGLPALYLLYLARLCGFALWVVLAWLALRVMPWGKWFLLTITLLPMTLFEAVGVSADAVTMGLSFLFVATVFRLLPKDQILKKDWALLAGFSMLLPLCKNLYILLLGLLVLIPFHSSERFGILAKRTFVRSIGKNPGAGKKRRAVLSKNRLPAGRPLNASLLNRDFSTACLSVIACWISALAVFFSWTALCGNQPSSNPIEGANATLQIVWMLEHPFDTVIVIVRSMLTQFTLRFQEMIGVLGWLDTWLPAYIYPGFAVILGLALWMDGPRYHWPIRLWTGLMFLGTGLAVFLSLYVVWTPVGDPVVLGVQGRYFIPLLPLVGASVGWLAPKAWRRVLPWTIPAIVVLLACSLYGLLGRYYVL